MITIRDANRFLLGLNQNQLIKIQIVYSMFKKLVCIGNFVKIKYQQFNFFDTYFQASIGTDDPFFDNF